MSEGDQPTRTVRRFAYLAGLVGFLFPFVTVSCMGEEIASPTGLQLATGAEFSFHEELGERERADVAELLAGENTAAPLLLLAVAGLAVAAVIAFSSKAITAPKGLTASLPLLVLLVLVIFWSDVRSQVREADAFLLDIAPGFGLWVTAAAALAGATAELIRQPAGADKPPTAKRPPPPPVSTKTAPAPRPSAPPPAAYCIRCGKPFRPPDQYCGGCGQPRNQ